MFSIFHSEYFWSIGSVCVCTRIFYLCFFFLDIFFGGDQIFLRFLHCVNVPICDLRALAIVVFESLHTLSQLHMTVTGYDTFIVVYLIVYL